MSAAPESYPLPPLGVVPYLPPTSYCVDHQGDRVSGSPCPNCRPLTEFEKIAHRQEWLWTTGRGEA